MNKPFFIFDVDGTLYRWQLAMDWFDVLAGQYPALQPLQKELHAILHSYRARQLSFPEYSELFVQKFWKERGFVGIREEDAIRAAELVVQEHGSRLYVFVRELIVVARDLGWRCLAISGSPEAVVRTLLRPFGIDAVLGTRFPVDVGGIFCPGVLESPYEDKGAALLRFLLEDGSDPAILRDSVAIGDSPSDEKMLELVGYPICFNPNRELDATAGRREWPIVVESRNVHFLLKGTASRQTRVSLQEILPQSLAQELETRLRCVPW